MALFTRGFLTVYLNHKIAHGIPSNEIISAELDGYFADTGGSFIIPPKKSSYEKLCSATMEAMYAGIFSAKDGEKLSTIGKSIQKIARKYDYNIIENLGSHGVGGALHEEP